MTRGRLQSLDMVRGIAIVAVLAFHFDARSGWAPLDALLAPIVRTGWVGVDLFFVLSGFLVGGMILEEAASPGGLRVGRFFARRALRLWPALFAYCGALALAGGWNMVWPALLHVQNYARDVPSHLWSLAVEEHFYLAAAFALPWLVLRGRLVPALLALLPLCLALRIAAACAGVPLLALQWQTQFRVDALACGVLLAWLHRARPDRFAWLTARRVPLVMGAGGAIAILALTGDGVFRHTIGFTLAWLAAAALLLALHGAREVRAARPLAWVGTIAYSLYLWHASIGRVAAQVAGSAGITQPLVIAMLQYSASIGMAAGLYALIERPFMRLRDRRPTARASTPLIA